MLAQGKIMRILLFFCLSMVLSAHSQEFRNFKLKNELALKAEITRGHKKSVQSKNIFDVDESLAKKILDLKVFDPNSDESPIYQRIIEELGTRYNSIGEEETRNLLLNRNIGGGVSNFNGMTWQKPMGSFKLGVDRQLAPDFLTDRYIVHDTFFIEIEASTLLQKLSDEELLDIDERGIGAFAGISFYRTYHYYHFADTFLEGLTSDFSKLFLSFLKFRKDYVLNLPPYEIMKREDVFTLDAGGLVSVPVWYNFTFQAGVIASVANKSELTIQSLGQGDSPKPGEFLRVAMDKKNSVGIGINLGLQLDFFNLLKLTILNYDLAYDYEKSHKFHLSFTEEDREKLKDGTKPAKEFNKLLHLNKDEVVYLDEDIVERDLAEQQTLESKYKVLLFGGSKQKETERIIVQKDGEKKVFFKHRNESKLKISTLLGYLFNLPGKNASETKSLNMEYEFNDSTEEQAVIDSEEKFSMNIELNYYAKKTHQRLVKVFRKRAIRNLENYTNVDPVVIEKVQANDLRGPMTINASFRIEKEGFIHFNQSSDEQVFPILMNICKSKNKRWLNPKKRFKMLTRVQVGRNLCVKRIAKKFYRYIEPVRELNLMNLKYFKNFINAIYKKSKSWDAFAALFDQNTAFLSGTFQAQLKDGRPFKIHFKDGDFRGLGVIDNYIRKEGAATPPAIK